MSEIEGEALRASPRRGASRMATLTGVFALVVATLLLLFSLLAVFPARSYGMWKLSILVKECGHMIAPLLLLTPFVWRRSTQVRIAAVIGLAAAVLLLTPMMGAVRVLSTLPDPHPGALRFVLSLYAGNETVVVPRALRIPARDGAPLDFYYYAPAAPAIARVHAPPLVVMIHGGGWHGGDARQLPALSYHLVRLGYAVAAVTYRFAPHDTFPAQMDDIRDELSFLRTHSVELGFDSSRMVLLGRSAGGHLALLYAYAAHDPAIEGVVSMYGPTDLPWGYNHPSRPNVYDSRATLIDFIGAPLNARRAAYVTASPITYAASISLPTLLIHGGSDDIVSVGHTRRLAAALLAARHPAMVLELPWATHGCDYIVRGPCYRLSQIAIDEFLTRVLPL